MAYDTDIPYIPTPVTESMWQDVLTHWEAIVADVLGESIGRISCAFCQEYNEYLIPSIYACKGCPIYAHTGKKFCDATPHRMVFNYIVKNRPNAATAGAKKELAFLTMLYNKWQKEQKEQDNGS